MVIREKRQKQVFADSLCGCRTRGVAMYEKKLPKKNLDKTELILIFTPVKVSVHGHTYIQWFIEA